MQVVLLIKAVFSSPNCYILDKIVLILLILGCLLSSRNSWVDPSVLWLHLWLKLQLCCLPMRESFACLSLALHFSDQEKIPAKAKIHVIPLILEGSITVMINLMEIEGEHIHMFKCHCHWSSFRFNIFVTYQKLCSLSSTLYPNGDWTFYIMGITKIQSLDSQIVRQYSNIYVFYSCQMKTLVELDDVQHADSINSLRKSGIKADMLCCKGKVDQDREQILLCWELLLVCCWPSLPAAISAKREHLSQAAGHNQYLSDPQRFRLPWPLQPLSPETPAVCAGQSAHVYVWDRLRPEALSP